MKSKEEILNSFYTASSDGQPEISAADLLNAIETYKDQCAEAAFNAARQQTGTVFEFAGYIDYVNHILQISQKEQEKYNNLDKAIALAANSVLPNFLPYDNSVNELSFHFTMQGTGYTAFYHKDANGYWQLSKWA